MASCGECCALNTNWHRIARGKGDEVRELVYQPQASGPEQWKDIKFMIFDLVPTPNTNMPFEQRLSAIEEWIESRQSQRKVDIFGQSNVELVQYQNCTGFDHLHNVLAGILQQARNIKSKFKFL
jgi:hypothetical protein